MPIYEFTCKKCNKKFIKKLELSPKDITVIRWPRCGTEDVLEMVSGFTCDSAGKGPGGLSALSKCGSFRFG
jgi:putative FmdB family regulatory protein